MDIFDFKEVDFNLRKKLLFLTVITVFYNIFYNKYFVSLDIGIRWMLAVSFSTGDEVLL